MANHFYIAGASETPTHLFFFIPGNPGCISYYEEFLTDIEKKLAESDTGSPGLENVNFAIVGTALANFGTTPDKGTPFSLQEQIAFVEKRLHEWSDYVRKNAGPRSNLKVVLAGHSVGAYIGMEVLRRWKEQAKIDGDGVDCHESKDVQVQPNVQVVGFIGLWPTITHIVRSPKGEKIGWLLRLTHTAFLASIIVRLITVLIPAAILRLTVRVVTGFPNAAAQTTLSFLRHPFQVRQALYMARDEMNQITEDRWQDDIWHAGPAGPKLMFLYGSEDEWVQNDAREQLFEARRTRSDRQGARMEIDNQSIPHAFCIRHSKAAADRTAGLIRDMINGV